MINLSELQTGNYIRRTETGEKIEVTGVGRSIVLYHNKELQQDVALAADEVEGIPANETKAMLAKFLRPLIGEAWGINHIQYVHQVQNLYQLLFDEEIDVYEP